MWSTTEAGAALALAEGSPRDALRMLDEAIRLARTLHALLPGEPEVGGLLALMLLLGAVPASAQLLQLPEPRAEPEPTKPPPKRVRNVRTRASTSEW